MCWPVLVLCCAVLSESLEACLDQGHSAEASLLRQTRKAELMSCVLGHSPGSQGLQTGLLLDLELKEQKLVRPFSCTQPVGAAQHDCRTQAEASCHAYNLPIDMQLHRPAETVLGTALNTLPSRICYDCSLQAAPTCQVLQGIGRCLKHASEHGWCKPMLCRVSLMSRPPSSSTAQSGLSWRAGLMKCSQTVPTNSSSLFTISISPSHPAQVL